jgi:hypothetical protein
MPILRQNAADGSAPGQDAVRLVHVVGQFRVRPAGAVQTLLGRPLDDPTVDLLGQVGRDLKQAAFGLARSQAIKAAFEVGVELALYGARRTGQIVGDVLVGTASAGQANDRACVSEVGRLAHEGCPLDLA